MGTFDNYLKTVTCELKIESNALWFRKWAGLTLNYIFFHTSYYVC